MCVQRAPGHSTGLRVRTRSRVRSQPLDISDLMQPAAKTSKVANEVFLVNQLKILVDKFVLARFAAWN